jgi:cellulose synthase/poly-beta-1,6-N-acetylglucosamine synthase-like glycosyltransferase
MYAIIQLNYLEKTSMIEITTILEFLVLFFAALPVLIFGIYGIIIFYYNKKKKIHSTGALSYESTEYEPVVSVVVPTHNEKSIISKRIENFLESNYPKDKLEVIFVDDSNDSTPEIIEDYSKKNPYIRLLRFNQRMGYSPSLIAGCNSAKGEIVVFAEASSFLEPDTIHQLVKNFKNPQIGAVTGKDVLLNLNEEKGQSENLYLRILDFLRQGESNMDSTVWMKGEAAAVRKELINDLEKLNAPGTADTAIALFVRSKGYRFIFDPTVRFYENSPSTREGLVKQKTIRAANLIKVIWSFRALFFKRKYGKFGSITLPFNFAMLAIAPISILSVFILLVAFTFFEPFISLILWAIIGLSLLIGLIISRKLVVMIFEFEYSLLKAFYEIVFVRKSHDKIDKVASTRRTA